jgi:two-component sensor histidine kinase
MRYLFFLPLYLLLSPVQPAALQAQPVARAEADRLRAALAASKPDTNRVKLLLRLGAYQVYKPGELKADIDTAYAYAKKAEGLSHSLRFEKGFEQSQYLLIQILTEGNRIDELKTWAHRSKAPKTKAALLLELGRHYLYIPGESEADLDSAEGYVRQALALNARLQYLKGQVESLMTLGGVFSERGNPSQAATYFSRAILLIEQVKDPLQRAGFWYQLGDHYTWSEAEMPGKIKAYEQALALYRQAGNQEQEANTLKTIADMHQHQGKHAQSLRELLEVLRIQKAIGFRNLHYTYDLLAHVHRTMGNHQQALPYTLAAIESAKPTADTGLVDFFYSRLGDIYRDLGQHQQALRMYRQLLARQLEMNADLTWSRVHYHNVIRSMLALNQPRQALAFCRQTLRQHPPKTALGEVYMAHALGEIYLALKDYPAAERHLRKALRATKAGNPFYLSYAARIDINQQIARLHLESGRYAKARYYLGQAFRLSEHHPNLLQKSGLHLQAFKLDSLQGRLAPAIAHYQRYKSLQDSLFNERKSNQLIAYQVQYDTEKKEQALQIKEQNIALLREQNKSQQAAIGQQRTLRNALAGGTTLLLLLLGVIYNRYRLKRRGNRQLEAQQWQLRAQQKEIREKNAHLSQLLGEKESLLLQKDSLIGEKEGLLNEKDTLLTQQERLLEEKERLLKEIHHRVKNNLQVVMSLLNSQAASLADKAALSAIRESQHRVQAMALIHQKLYQSEGLARIPMQAYIKELVAYLRDSYRLSQPVRFRLEVESIEIDVTQAVPLGLILNEAVTNACKYAFPGGRAGTVNISLCRVPGVEPGAYQLRIEDDGVGLPEGFDPARSRSLGMTLMHGFSRQLKGKLTLGGPPGLSIRLVFAEEKLPTTAPAKVMLMEK